MNLVLQSLKSRTVWFAILIAVLSVLQGFVFALPFPVWAQAVVGCAIAAGVAVLRFLTTEPLLAK